jgi:CheY-like chemotaxis protein
MRALIVDDQKDVRALTVTCLHMLGLECCDVPSGREALHCLEQGVEFDVIVTDLHMPYMNGLELLKEVKRRYPLLPVILLSASGEASALQQAYQQGAAYCLERPYLKGHFEEALRAIRLL